jgi:hypothetical protein
MTTLREAAQQALEALDVFANAFRVWPEETWAPHEFAAMDKGEAALDALRAALKQEETLQVKPTKIMGPNLEELLNGAGFYRRTSLGYTAIMDLMDTVPRGTFYGVDRGDAMRIWLLAASATEKAHGIKEVNHD